MASTTTSADTGNSLRRYLAHVQDQIQLPLLSAEEELRLAERWRDHGDQRAADKLVTSHLRLVAKMAVEYRGYSFPLEDLISVGNVGMMQAVQRFDPDRGFRLSTYAMWWIRAAIQEYILHNTSLVKMGTTAAQKKLFFNLRRVKRAMHITDNRELTPEQVAQIANELDVPEQDVVHMNGRLSAPDASLNAPVYPDKDPLEPSPERQDFLVDTDEGQDTVLAGQEELDLRRRLLNDALKTLNERQRHIVIERRLKEEPTTLEALRKEYKVSRERIRQIEMRAFEKVQKHIKAALAQRQVEAATRLQEVQCMKRAA